MSRTVEHDAPVEGRRERPGAVPGDRRLWQAPRRQRRRDRRAQHRAPRRRDHQQPARYPVQGTWTGPSSACRRSGADLGPRSAAPRWTDRIVPDQPARRSSWEPDGRRYPVWIAELSLASVVVRGPLPLVAQNEQFQVGSRKAKVTSFSGNRATFNFHDADRRLRIQPQDRALRIGCARPTVNNPSAGRRGRHGPLP